MDYSTGIKLLPGLDSLKYKSLKNEQGWAISSIALLPAHIETLAAYTNVLDWSANNNWLANGINHEFVYLKTGIYYRQDGTHFDDDLTIYILLKQRVSPLEAKYKAEFLTTLIHNGDILKEDIPDWILQHL